MSKPTQWTTSYSSVFRDRQQYKPPNAEPSDESWAARTQGYYGPRAALSEHAARTAEVEARTQYGSIVPNESATQRNFAPTSTSGMGAAGLNLSGSRGSSSFGTTYTAGSTGSLALNVSKYSLTQKDLWTHPILPHTGVVQNNVPIGYGASTFANYNATATRPVFTNGYNNGYASEFQWEAEAQQPAVPQGNVSPPPPQSHIPGCTLHMLALHMLAGQFARSSRICSRSFARLCVCSDLRPRFHPRLAVCAWRHVRKDDTKGAGCAHRCALGALNTAERKHFRPPLHRSVFFLRFPFRPARAPSGVILRLLQPAAKLFNIALADKSNANFLKHV